MNDVTVEPKQGTPNTDDEWTVRRVIQWTTEYLRKNGSETPRLDTEILLAHARNCQRIDLYTHFHDVLTNAERACMRELVRRRAGAVPVAYLVGHREFFGLNFQVTPAVLVPRPETETLVMAALDAAQQFTNARIWDVGTGSGCVAVSLAVQLPQAEITATDICREALQVAERNATAHQVNDRIQFLQGDLFEALSEDGLFDVIVSNPPYVAQEEMASLDDDVRLHEPELALNAGPGGLEILSRIVDQSPKHLRTGGHLIVEIAINQAEPVRNILTSCGAYDQILILNDLTGRPRVVQARRTAAGKDE